PRSVIPAQAGIQSAGEGFGKAGSLIQLMVMVRKHSMPDFLIGEVTPEAYERWLTRKAAAHVKRDRKRGYSSVAQALYKEAIHAAVILSKGRDCYTGEPLNWRLISTYKNEESKEGKHRY